MRGEDARREVLGQGVDVFFTRLPENLAKRAGRDAFDLGVDRNDSSDMGLAPYGWSDETIKQNSIVHNISRLFD